MPERGNIYSKFSSNSERNVSELVEKFEEITVVNYIPVFRRKGFHSQFNFEEHNIA